MLSDNQLRQDVRGLIEKGMTKLDDADWRQLRWKSAALAGPLDVGTDPIAAQVHAERIGKLRAELLKKLRKLERLEAMKDSSLVPADQRQGQPRLEEECDWLAEAILDAEETTPEPALARRAKGANTVERLGSVPFSAAGR